MTREEIDRIKAAVRVEDVAARYVPSLRRVGERLVGLCPFHNDTDPSLNIWPGNQSWYCFGACRMGGDVIDFVQEAEGIGFPEALERLEREAGPRAAMARTATAGPVPAAYREEAGTGPTEEQEEPLDAEEHAILNAAAEIYYRTLMTNRQWRRWVAERGVSLATMRHFHVGYCSGRRLVGYLQWRRLSLDKACKLGLHCDGLEHLSQRIVIPVMEQWRTPFLIGRATRDGQRPKYLGLARPKVPLVDAVETGARKDVIVVEGPFDLMVLHEWGVQERFDLLSLLGTGVKRSWLPAFDAYERVIVATDQDEAGAATAEDLAERLPGRVIRVTWPAEYEDVGALGQTRAGRAIFASALAQALREGPRHAPAARRHVTGPGRARQGRLPGVGA